MKCGLMCCIRRARVESE